MKFFKILCALLALSFTFSTQLASAKDKEYRFNFSGYVSEEIDNQDDLALLKAAEYSLKKGYDYFIILKTDRYDKAKKNQGNARLGRKRSTRPRLRTTLEIHCYDADPDLENSHNAEQVKNDINQKYSD